MVEPREPGDPPRSAPNQPPDTSESALNSASIAAIGRILDIAH